MRINYQSNLFHRIYLAGFFLILALPLLNWPIYFSPPNWAKTFVFQIIFSILLFVFLCQLLWQRNHAIFSRVWKIGKENLAFWLLLALLVAYFLATVFSLDFKHSFFGSPYRGGGFINYGFYILFAAMAFLVIKGRDWQKLWDFSILVGMGVCILAFMSYFGLLRNIVISRTDNLSSTIGGPNTLGLYLLLLVFMALSFGLREASRLKKALYIISFVLFSCVIVLTISQGAYLGLGLGILYFFFFYPSKSLSAQAGKKLFYAKGTLLILIILAVAGALFISNNPDNALNKNYLFKQLTTWSIDESRLSTWQVAWNAFVDRPILGYGPENFSIGFDRHYDPSLSAIHADEQTAASWWDKAHNFALNLLVETGIIGFLAFALLFAWIFFKLHKATHRPRETEQDSQANPLITHGLQATLIAYFTNLMFNFENFSSYILVFLIIGYALHLTIPKEAPAGGQNTGILLFKYRKPITGTAFVLIICFLWFFAIKPFNANANINKAIYLADNRMCNQAIAVMQKELKKHSVIDGYTRIKYADIIKRCIQYYPENDVAYAKKGIEALQENVYIMPYYTRNWLIMSAFNNMVAVAETDPGRKKELINQSMEYLKNAEKLSPHRLEMLVETISLYLFQEDYESVKKMSEECIGKYPKFNACYWYLGLARIYQAKNQAIVEEGKRLMEKAQSMGYSQLSQYSLTRLAFFYISKENYQELEWVYQKLTEYYPYNSRYFAGLAMVYKKNGKLEKSMEALKGILSIQSDARAIENKLTEPQEIITSLIENILGLKESNPEYHAILHQLYLQMAQDTKDPKAVIIYKEKAQEEYSLSQR